MTKYIPIACIIGTLLTVVYYQFKQRIDRDNARADGFFEGLSVWFAVSSLTDEDLHDLSIRQIPMLVHSPKYDRYHVALYNHAMKRFECETIAMPIEDVVRFRFIDNSKLVEIVTSRLN